MKVAVLEVRYEGGLVLSDHVLLLEDSSRLLVSPRLSNLLDILDESERRTSIRVKHEGTTYRVEREPAGDYVLGSKANIVERCLSYIQEVKSPTADQRRLNGRFAHILSAGSLIGACYIVQSTVVWSTGVILETATLCLSAVVLFFIGHVFFSDDGRSTR